MTPEEKRRELKKRLLKKKLAEKNKQREIERISMADSAFRGGQQGLSFGFSDEALGALQALPSLVDKDKTYSEEYGKARDEWRDYYKKGQEANPLSYGAGEYGTAIATALVPGGAALQAGRAAKLGSTLGRAALAGGAAGAGYSEAEDMGGVGREALLGAGLGAATLGAGKALSPVAKKGADLTGRVAGKIGKKVMRTGLGVGEEAQERYLQRPEAVRKSRTLEELGGATVEGVENLKKRVIEGSQQAIEKIPENTRVSSKSIKETLQSLITDFDDAITPSGKKARRDLQELLKDFDALAKKQEGPKGSISAKKLKPIIKDLDRDIKAAEGAGVFNDPGMIAKMELRKSLDKTLKKTAPEYREAMTRVAKDARALGKASKLFKDEDKAITKLKTLATRGDQRPVEMSVLKSMDQRLGTDLAEENADRLVREAFEKTHTQGTRNVAFGALAGSIMGYPGLVAGGAFGYLTDKYGPKMAQKILDTYMKKYPSRAMSPLVQKLKPGYPEIMGYLGERQGSKYFNTSSQTNP